MEIEVRTEGQTPRPVTDVDKETEGETERRKSTRQGEGQGEGRGEIGKRQRKRGDRRGRRRRGGGCPRPECPPADGLRSAFLTASCPGQSEPSAPALRVQGGGKTATGPKATLSASPQNRASVHSWWGDVNSPPDSGTWLMFSSPWASALSFN